MDIAALSTMMSLNQAQNDAGVAILSKQLDSMEDMGDAMVKALEQSVTPHLGANIDISI